MQRLHESARQWVLRNLPYDQCDSDLVKHLHGLDAHGLLVVYHNWMIRLIKPQPRRVMRSTPFDANPIATARKADLDIIIADIEAGRELKKYLSRGVKVAAQVPGKSLGRRQDLDLMLIEWGVHHLHVSTNLEPDGFVKRDDPLLFAAFKPDTAYLIDVLRHGDWTRDHVLKTLYTEWPNAGLIDALKNVVGLSHSYTEEGRAKLRRAGANVAVDIGGVVVMGRGGFSGAGTSIQATRDADRLLIQLDAFEDEWVNHFSQMKRKLAAQGFDCPDNPEFEFAIMRDGYGVIEATTGTWIRL